MPNMGEVRKKFDECYILIKGKSEFFAQVHHLTFCISCDFCFQTFYVCTASRKKLFGRRTKCKFCYVKCYEVIVTRISTKNSDPIDRLLVYFCSVRGNLQTVYHRRPYNSMSLTWNRAIWGSPLLWKMRVISRKCEEMNKIQEKLLEYLFSI